jgi:hypothetical protein
MPASGGNSVRPQVTTLYSSPQARPSSVTGAVLERDAAAVGEERRVEGAQLVGAAVDVLTAGRLAHVPVRLERRDGRFDIAGREGALVLADDVAVLEAGVGLQQRRPARVRAGQRPGAEVHAQLEDAGVLVAVGGKGQGKLHAPIVAVDVKDDLLDAAARRDDEIDVLDRDVALRDPGVGVRHEPAERVGALDAPAYRMMHLGLADERLDERVGLPGDQAVEIGHRREALLPALVQDALQGRGGEQLR